MENMDYEDAKKQRNDDHMRFNIHLWAGKWNYYERTKAYISASGGLQTTRGHVLTMREIDKTIMELIKAICNVNKNITNKNRLTLGKTFVLPMSEDTQNLKNCRAIICLNIINKNLIIARRKAHTSIISFSSHQTKTKAWKILENISITFYYPKC